jgi:hypothetical protein
MDHPVIPASEKPAQQRKWAFYSITWSARLVVDRLEAVGQMSSLERTAFFSVMTGIEDSSPTEGRHDNAAKPTLIRPSAITEVKPRMGRDRVSSK